MDWNVVVKMLETGGPMAIIAGIMIWHNIKVSDKLVSIVEQNTRALTEMRDVIKVLADRIK